MNKYVKEFLHRGLLFAGFGPVIVGFIYLILEHKINDFTLSGTEVFTVVISTYLLGFIHAGTSVFNQIEHWSVMKSLFCQLGSLYVAYVVCYLVNSWIPFDLSFLIIFTGIFVAAYLVIWTVVYASVKSMSKKMSKNL